MEHFNFTKDILKNYHVPDYGMLDECRSYRVFDKDVLLGSFICTAAACFINFGNNDLRIFIEKRFLKNSAYTIIDHHTGTEIGHYDIPAIRFLKLPPLRLFFKNKRFELEKLRTNMPFSIFNRRSWGQYRLKVGDEKQEVIYEFNTPGKKWGLANREFSAFDGILSFEGEDHFLIFCGFLLVEKVLHDDDEAASSIG